MFKLESRGFIEWSSTLNAALPGEEMHIEMKDTKQEFELVLQDTKFAYHVTASVA